VDLSWVERAALIDLLADGAEEHDIRIILEDEKAQIRKILLRDSLTDAKYDVVIKSRRLGEDNGRDTLLDIAGQLRALQRGQQGKHRALTEQQKEKIRAIQASFASSQSKPFNYIAF
jgi:hypothetical protein